MASESSALEVLSMQQVSIQTYSNLSSLARLQVFWILWYPARLTVVDALGSCMFLKVTSPSPQVCERIAYLGTAGS